MQVAMPHPMAWPDTVDAIYGSRAVVELGEEIKENVLFLGGKWAGEGENW